MIFCCFGSRDTVESTYDPRFGAPNISAPNEGAYNNQADQTSAVVVDVPNPSQQGPIYQHPDSENIENQDSTITSPQSPASKHLSYISSFSTHAAESQSSLPLNNPRLSGIPVHAAYILSVRNSIQTTSSPREAEGSKGADGRTASNPSSPSASTHVTTPITTPTTGGSTHTWPNLSPKLFSSQMQSKRASYNPPGGLARTMKSDQPQTRPHIQLEPVPQRRGGKKTSNMTPQSAESVEQWPGSY